MRMLWAIMKKEFMHISKDKQSLLIIVILPVIMLLLFGYAITMEMRNIPTIISDLSQTKASRELIRSIGSSNFFRIQLKNVSPAKIDQAFQNGTARCVIIIPQDFTKNRAHSRTIQAVIDASDPNAANFINNYLSAIIQQHNPRPLFTPEIRFLYNPELRAAEFFVPGLIAVILLLVCALLTSIAIAREKETGTMEQLLVSPVTPTIVVIGKTLPYIILGLVNALTILVIGVFWFKVPIMGSLANLFSTMLLYIFSGLSIGILVSSITRTQRDAMVLTMLLTILPTIMLSGFIFPVDSMPLIFRWIAPLSPAYHFIQIVRSIMLKGVDIQHLLRPIFSLSIITFVLLFISIKKFRIKLE